MTPVTYDPHGKALGLLKMQIRKGIFPHAHLFAGPEGVGRKDVARDVAKAVLCFGRKPESCSGCPSCSIPGLNNHPDYFEVSKPEGKQSLPIDSIREIQYQASRKPVVSKSRVFVLDGCESMTLEAANCFLKTLEEPPGECYLVLISSTLQNIPDTIVSRCQVTKLTGLLPGKVAENLRALNEPPDALWLAMRSWGSPGMAMKFQHYELHEFNRSLIEKVLAMRPENNFEMTDFFQEKAKKLADDASGQRSILQELLECLAIIYRDVAALTADGESLIFNESHRNELACYAEGRDMDIVLDCSDMVIHAILDIGKNLNRRLILDDLFSHLAFH